MKWNKIEIKILIEEYPHTKTDILAKKLNRSMASINSKASFLGLKKTNEYLAQYIEAFLINGAKSRFQKGANPHNKGKKRSEFMSVQAIEKCKKTQFTKGNSPHNCLPTGAERIRYDRRSGKKYQMIKLENRKTLQYKHVYIWEIENKKKVPKGFNIIFKDGDTENLRIENLECISNAELMLKNTIHNYPPELVQEIKKIAKFKKIIKEKSNGKIKL